MQETKKKVGTGRDILPDYKQEELYQVWKQCRSDKQVSRQCDIDWRTIKRYRLKYNWAQRLELETSAIVAKSPQDVEVVKNYRLQQVFALIDRAAREAFKAPFKNAKQAVDSVVELIKLELLLRGEATDRRETIISKASERFQEDRKQVKLGSGDYTVTDAN